MAQPHDTTPLTTSGSTSDCRTRSAPPAAPRNMLSTDAPRRHARGLAPPASAESAASPVRVNVRTVVVRSGNAILRTVAFLTPMARSEEHTSELQSRLHLVCRLLLEKKKKHEVI